MGMGVARMDASRRLRHVQSKTAESCVEISPCASGVCCGGHHVMVLPRRNRCESSVSGSEGSCPGIHLVRGSVGCGFGSDLVLHASAWSASP